MALSETDIKMLSAKLIGAKNRVVIKNPFFGSLLAYLSLALDDECPTARTNGEIIAFGTDFLSDITDSETEYVMLHELMHCVLGHAGRREHRDRFLFNIAADIVINSVLLEFFNDDISRITVRGNESIHIAPDGQEGRKYSSEEVYAMLMNQIDSEKLYKNFFFDDHNSWGETENDEIRSELSSDGSDESKIVFSGDAIDSVWAERIYVAEENTKHACGKDFHLPDFFRKYVRKIKSREIDWRLVLGRFCQNINLMDYSWQKADRRYSESGLFIPDFAYNESNVKEAKNILFFVDTSGSVNDYLVSTIMAEIRNAISVFDGRLEGKVGFFDTKVIAPVPFYDEDSFNKIAPSGGGGTSFECVFEYVKENFSDNLPSAIVILTDGYAEFPSKSFSEGVPVLWIICDSAVEPPWGEFVKVQF